MVEHVPRYCSHSPSLRLVSATLVFRLCRCWFFQIYGRQAAALQLLIDRSGSVLYLVQTRDRSSVCLLEMIGGSDTLRRGRVVCKSVNLVDSGHRAIQTRPTCVM